ncbi:helix-turn-helix transcriptional regulator [Microlunatus soli]|uniref:Helix-turn-helix domain-containing protein n=1 Tax=Microlunatus soli TaxID=630515 RepID=A0A1H2AJ09_9ACTN|nr:helix-turn-helix transcriptional regulator [Microlunatus soli]SDT45849.1 Helix-turn-helix domain-containing protein [Microlunatus soli]
MGTNDLGEFLRARRAGLTPDAVGLPIDLGTGRRVTGLRRSEVAQLAGVSTEYYTRLEQGRARQPSEQVLQALAEALQFDDIERRHLFALAGTTAGHADRTGSVSRLRPALRQVLDSMELAPAFVSDRDLTVVGGNTLWRLLFPEVAELPRRERSMARWTLLDPRARLVWNDWERVARDYVHGLRLAAAAQPRNQRIAALIGELMMRSAEFPAWWSEHRVQERSTGLKRLHHPVVGDLELQYEIFTSVADPGQSLVVYSAPAGSPSQERLRLLASWGTEPATERTQHTVTQDTVTES